MQNSGRRQQMIYSEDLPLKSYSLSYHGINHNIGHCRAQVLYGQKDHERQFRAPRGYIDA